MGYSRQKLTRRAWLGVAGAAVAAALTFRSLTPRIRTSMAAWLNHEEGLDRLPSHEELVVVANFAGALAGHRIAPEDVELLAARLMRIAKGSSQRAAQYAEISAFANRRARALQPGADGFAGATDDVREAVVKRVMTEPRWPGMARLAILSDDGRTGWRMRQGVAGHLRDLYRRSPAPWKARGYRGWPGFPADRLDYTRPGPKSVG